MKQTMDNVMPVEQVFTNGNIRVKEGEGDQYNALKDSIEELGQIVPVTVYEDGGKFYIETGHQRLKAIQELGMSTIKVMVVPKPNVKDHSLRQYHENLFRVDMSLFEEVVGLLKIVKENPKVTYKQLSARFGRNTEWISSRMTIANLHPDLLHSGFVMRDNFGDLVNIGRYSLNKQKDAINAYCKEHKLSKSEFQAEVLADDLRVWDLTRHFDQTTPEPSDMLRVFTQEEIDDYWKGYKKTKKTFGLFDEAAIHYDWSFVHSCLKDKYPDRLAVLKEIPVKTLDGWSESQKAINWSNLFIAEDEEIEAIKTWNANYSNLKVIMKKTATVQSSLDVNGKVQERSRFHGCGTKLARAIVPHYFEYVNKYIEHGQNVIEWLHEFDCSSRWSLSKACQNDLETLVECYGMNEIPKALFGTYVQYCIDNSTIKELDILAQNSNKLSVKDWISDQFVLAEATQIREDILKAFKTDDLKKAYNAKGKTKSAIVDELKNKATQFKFNGIFKDKDANFWNQMCKTYLTNSEE